MSSSGGVAGESCSSLPEVPKQYGVTKPISMAGPTEFDLQRTRDLENVLKSDGLYESEEQSALRVEVLSQIEQVTKRCIKNSRNARFASVTKGEIQNPYGNRKLYTSSKGNGLIFL